MENIEGNLSDWQVEGLVALNRVDVLRMCSVSKCVCYCDEVENVLI